MMNNEPVIIHDKDGIIVDATLNGIELSVGLDSQGEWVMVDDVLFYLEEWTEALNLLNEMLVMLRKEQ